MIWVPIADDELAFTVRFPAWSVMVELAPRFRPVPLDDAAVRVTDPLVVRLAPPAMETPMPVPDVAVPDTVMDPDVAVRLFEPRKLIPRTVVDVPLIVPVPAPTDIVALLNVIPLLAPAEGALRFKLPVPTVEMVALVIEMPPPDPAVMLIEPPFVAVIDAPLDTVMPAAALRVRLEPLFQVTALLTVIWPAWAPLDPVLTVTLLEARAA